MPFAPLDTVKFGDAPRSTEQAGELADLLTVPPNENADVGGLAAEMREDAEASTSGMPEPTGPPASKKPWTDEPLWKDGGEKNISHQTHQRRGLGTMG